jgi:hypothetical protein
MRRFLDLFLLDLDNYVLFYINSIEGEVKGRKIGDPEGLFCETPCKGICVLFDT